MTEPKPLATEHGPERMTISRQMESDLIFARKMFDEWWQDEGKRQTQSLLVASENLPLVDKVRMIFLDGFLLGLGELHPKPKPNQIEPEMNCPQCGCHIHLFQIRE